jgi:hypothetical protein
MNEVGCIFAASLSGKCPICPIRPYSMNTVGLTDFAEFGFNAAWNVLNYHMSGSGRVLGTTIEIDTPSQGDFFLTAKFDSFRRN